VPPQESPRIRRRLRCGACGREATRVAPTRRPARRWRDLAMRDHVVELVYAPHRVWCRHCGLRVERIPWAEIVGNTAKPSIQVLADPTVAGRFEEIAILPPAQASYHVGDSLLLARIDRNEDEWGDVVVPVGVARVTAVQPHQVLALVIMQFGRIKGGSLAMPLEPFKDPGPVRPTAVEQGLEGRLIGMRDEHVLAGSQQVVFIDKGRADGVALGDAGVDSAGLSYRRIADSVFEISSRANSREIVYRSTVPNADFLGTTFQILGGSSR